jgi:cell division protein FtsB
VSLAEISAQGWTLIIGAVGAQLVAVIAAILKLASVLKTRSDQTQSTLAIAHIQNTTKLDTLLDRQDAISQTVDTLDTKITATVKDAIDAHVNDYHAPGA